MLSQGEPRRLFVTSLAIVTGRERGIHVPSPRTEIGEVIQPSRDVSRSRSSLDRRMRKSSRPRLLVACFRSSVQSVMNSCTSKTARKAESFFASASVPASEESSW
jgi:hypothetical protein